MSFDFLNKKKKIREAEEQARMEEEQKREAREREAREREAREREAREKEEREKEEQQKHQARLRGVVAEMRISELSKEIPEIIEDHGDWWRTELRSIAHDIRTRINEYCVKEHAYIDSRTIYEPELVCEYLDKKLIEMQTRVSRIEAQYSRITQIQQEVLKIREETPSVEDRWILDAVSRLRDGENWKTRIMERGSEASRETIVSQVKKNVDDFKQFLKRTREFPSSKMMDLKNYGRINTAYWNAIQEMNRSDVVKYIVDCDQLIMEVTDLVNQYPSSFDYSSYLSSDEFTSNLLVDRFYTINLEKIMQCVWFLAIEKPFSEGAFSKACVVFRKIYRLPFEFDVRFFMSHADIRIARMYAQKSVGGETVVHELVEKEFRHYVGPSGTIASGLMWLGMYKTEHMVLQYALAHNYPMTAQMQERLRTLNSSDENMAREYDVKSTANVICFDTSALTWRDNEYIDFFKDLTFQNKVLTHSLAIRSENKELFIPQGISIPGNDEILKKLNSVFEEEYGESVVVQSFDCIALSGSGEERVKGIMAISNDCKQMGILMHMARIGKKLIIRFYTLFVPTGSDLATQKQQALSIYKNLSLSVSMWESSLTDTMLMAMEQLLNSVNQSGNNAHTANVHSGVCDEPVF